MTPKITPTKRVPRFERYNCGGKLRVQVNTHNGEISEVICLPKKGGCKYNLQLIGRLLTGMLECNISLDYIIAILRDNDPCPAVVMRMKRENLPESECGIGGCSKVILAALESKADEEKKKEKNA